MTSLFSDVEVAPSIEVYELNYRYIDDASPVKVNLTVGAYRTDEGQPWVLPVVREAKEILASDSSLNHEYLPVLGYEPFCRVATELLLGQDSNAIKQGRTTGAQGLSGTGSVRMGAEFLARVVGLKNVFISTPSWSNHSSIFSYAGFNSIRNYRYWDSRECRIDIDGMIADLEAAPEKSVIVLHGCAHNPTGMDPTPEQWKRIAGVIKSRRLFPFFDIAYQGFASGDVDRDAWAVRHFVEQGIEVFAAQSFAKNFGLYGERVGNLTAVFNDSAVIPAFKSQMAHIIRANWSNPPGHGARIVHKVLATPKLRAQWLDEIRTISTRIHAMRVALREALEILGTPGNWEHMTKQIGMFSYTGLTGTTTFFLSIASTANYRYKWFRKIENL